MKGRKLVGHQQLTHLPAHKTNSPRLIPKRKLNQVRSQEPKPKPKILHPHPGPPKLIRPQPYNSATDYDLQRKQRQTLNYIPIGQSFHENVMATQLPAFRSQRNSNNQQFLYNRENNFINPDSSRSLHYSAPRIKIFSLQKEKSFSRSERSENSSVKRRAGIELTKTLLKRISGMYTDKDFQNRSSQLYKNSREETTGIMTNTMSGRVQDEYQLSDFDLQIYNNNHTFNLSSSNQISFNDSGTWHKINESGHWNQQNEYKQDNNWKKNSESVYWNKRNDSGYEQNPRHKERKEVYESAQRSASKQKPRISFNSPKKELVKVKSYDLFSSRPVSQSIEIGAEPPCLQNQRRPHPQAAPEEDRYVIQSKNKTLEQLSLKQSMVIGFDNYYQ